MEHFNIMYENNYYMNLKQYAILIIFLLFILPSLIGIVVWSMTLYSHSTTENVKTGMELLVDAETPWWLGIMQFFASLGTVGGFLTIGLVAIIRWTGIYT